MNFSSIQAYLEPSNWQQQNGQSMGNSGANTLFQPPSQTVLPPLQPVQPNGGGGGGGGVGSIRPGSMTEKARLANIPMPETSLKCPRCQSTNTKFCYFNNYNLTQPRHFCKTCRRYWTKGGALRSVPVGGVCRRNKRSKSSASKTSPKREIQTTPVPTTTVTGTNPLGLSQQLPPLHFMPPLMSHQLTSNFNTSAVDMGLGYRGVMAPNMSGANEMNFEQWRMQQFPFFDGSENHNHHELNRSSTRQVLGNDEIRSNNNVCVNNAWPDDLSSFSNNNINRNL